MSAFVVDPGTRGAASIIVIARWTRASIALSKKCKHKYHAGDPSHRFEELLPIAVFALFHSDEKKKRRNAEHQAPLKQVGLQVSVKGSPVEKEISKQSDNDYAPYPVRQAQFSIFYGSLIFLFVFHSASLNFDRPFYQGA